MNKKTVFFAILVMAMICFEVFNFDATRNGLAYFFGDKNFMGIYWAVILAVAACSIDIVGMVRIFTDEINIMKEGIGVWISMGVWLIAASINAVLTWWSVSLVLVSENIGNEIASRETLVVVFPVVSAVFIWLLRVGLVGTLASLGDQVFHAKKVHSLLRPLPTRPTQMPKRPAVNRPIIHKPGAMLDKDDGSMPII